MIMPYFAPRMSQITIALDYYLLFNILLLFINLLLFIIILLLFFIPIYRLYDITSLLKHSIDYLYISN